MEQMTATSSAETAPEIVEVLQKYVDWHNLPTGHFIHQVERARSGANAGISNGMKNLSKYTYGTQKGRYYLLGAASAAGKTTVADFMFILNAWEYCKAHKRKIYFFYYSFEISRPEKTARWVSYYIHRKHGVNIPSDYIMGRIPGIMVTGEHMDWIREAYDEVEEIFSHMRFMEDPVHPTRMFHAMIEGHYEKIGTVLRHKSPDPKKKGSIKGWVPNAGEEDTMTMIIVDHLALAATEQGFNTKQTMDLWSKYFVTLRNLFGATEVVIQQFNTDLAETHRGMKKGEVPNPQVMDFGDSRYTFRDADVVMAIIKPYQFDSATYRGYDIRQLKGYMLMLFLMKNRYGFADRQIPLFLNPISGIPYDLPLEQVEQVLKPYYEQAARLDKLALDYTPKT